MNASSTTRGATIAMGAGVGIAAGAYAAYAGMSWYRYGHVPPAHPDERDELLDRFLPTYHVVERHSISVRAPSPITLTAAREQDLLHLPLVRAIFRAREIVLGATPNTHDQPRGLLAAVQSLGWGVLADVPDQEIVMGAVTKPWEANVTFHALPPDEFASFARPGVVKIAWTLRADRVDATSSIFRTETRAIATDAIARSRFRTYWAFASPGIALIRWLSIEPLKRDAERRAHASRLHLAPLVPRAGC